MFRRLMLAALALCAFLALESCGASRIAAPLPAPAPVIHQDPAPQPTPGRTDDGLRKIDENRF